MKPHRECPLCIISVRFNELYNAVEDTNQYLDASKHLLKISLEAFSTESELTRIASRIFNELSSRYPGIVEYYRRVKRISIDNALRQVGELKKDLEGLRGYELFKTALRISIAGNLLDTGVAYYKPPGEVSRNIIYSTPFSIDHSLKLYGILSRGGLKVTWVFDNAGEAIFDTVLIDLIRDMGNRVFGIVKSDPGFQNDLTVSDAEYAGLARHLDGIVETGYSGSTIHLDKVSKRVLETLNESDLVILKGMSNYEYVSEVDLGRLTAFLLIPKCDPVARSLNAVKGTFVAMVKPG